MKKSLSNNENFSLAVENYKKKNFGAAESICRKILNIDSKHFDSIWLMGMLAARTRNFHEAKNFFLKAIEINPNSEKAYNNLGNTCKELGEFNEASDFYQKSINIEPNNANAHYNLGNSNQQLQKFDKALISYQQAIKIKPDYFHAYYSSGNIHHKIGNFEDAKNFYEKTIQIMSKHAGAHNNLGLIFNKLGKSSQAIACYEKAIEIKSDYTAAYVNLGLVYTEQGQFMKAIDCYKNAIKQEPQNLNNYYYLINLQKEKLDLNLKSRIENILKEKKSTQLNYAYGNFLLAKYKNKEKNYKEELDYLIKGHSYYIESNKSLKKEIKYWLNDLPKIKNLVDKVKSKRKNKNHELNPIFIVGVPRCGSTLIEKIITSGKKFIPCGEETTILSTFFKEVKLHEKSTLNFDKLEKFKETIFQRYKKKNLVQKNSDYIFTDKSLENFFYLELIKEMYPKAKIVNCQRNILSSIMSIFQNNLTGLAWTHDLENIFKYFNNYFNQIKYYNEKIPNFIYNLNFEKFINNPVIESKKLMEFCELPWDKKCLEYYKRKDLVSKTTSNIQIRKAIFKGVSDKYKPYKNFLKKYSNKYSWFN